MCCEKYGTRGRTESAADAVYQSDGSKHQCAAPKGSCLHHDERSCVQPAIMNEQSGGKSVIYGSSLEHPADLLTG
jgi:hypothetical protein